MCGRFTLTTEIQQLRDHFSAGNTVKFHPSFNISPASNIPIVRQEDGDCRLSLCHWGLIPNWSKPENKYKAINARAETLAEKPFFRDAFKQRRCLIPATGFYEWKKINGGKQAYYFYLKNNKLFAFAGLWESWRGPDQTIESCAIVTTAANITVQPVHDRMPVILEPQNYAEWLQNGTPELLHPFTGAIECHAVGSAVNNPRNDQKSLIDPVS